LFRRVNRSLIALTGRARPVYAVCAMAEFIEDEILEMAVAREVDANRFYLALAERVENPGIKKMFEKLAAEELEHKAKLELEIMKTGRVIHEGKTPSGFHDQQPDYVPPEIKMSYKDILQMGIQKEEASFRLYTDLAGMTSDDNSKEILLALAREEAGHKQRFQKIFEFLSHIA
jgi:rubrerythrin